MSNSKHRSAQIFEGGLFRAPDRAQQTFDRLRSNLANELLDAALALLAESPDPDQSLNLFERLVTAGGEQITRLLNKNRVLLHYTLLIFGHSYWLGETIIQHPDILRALERDKQLDRSLGPEDYLENLARFRSRSTEMDPAILLARFKKREYVRILLRDVLGIATLAETTDELSALADVILKEALQEVAAEMRRRFGSPEYSDARGRLVEARFAVLSLGKLGGNELNYASDLDLLFLYDGEESTASVSLREYFTRQAQLLTELLSRTTPEGSLFRIDLRLRPQGNEGPPAISLRAALDYYANIAHDWELQALIKARCSAGDTALAREFIRQTHARVYTKDLNFAAIETALLSREKIQTRRIGTKPPARAPKSIDVKLDRGGIRDIEFLVQCLQRVYGGEERWLRSGGTLFSLQKLHDKGHISGKDFHDLTLAYEFLRRIEHRLQVQRGQQLHRLPADPDHLNILQRALGPGPAHATGDLLADVQQQMGRVAEIYDRIIHSHRRRERKLSPGEAAAPSANSSREMSFAQILERLAEDCPELHSIAAAPELSLHLRRGLHRFLASALTSRDRYAPLLEKPDRLRPALSILEMSEHLTEILVRYPDAIKVLDQFPTGETRAHAEISLAPASAGSGIDRLSQLRTAFRKYNFAIAAQDVLAPGPAFASLRESSLLADEAIRLALEIVHGSDKLAVLALGRLGTSEFDIGSDADLLFVRPERGDEDHARNAAEKLVQALSAYTREGSIFAVDTRLRPRGGEGELVITPVQLERYLTTEARPWEALSYTKLRFVAGRQDLAPLTLAPTWRRITQMGAQPGFAAAVVEMRTRLEKANRYPHSFKQARGGFYDIDFIASYLMLRHASISGGNILERLEHLHTAGMLNKTAFSQLRDAAILYRTTDHVIRLVTGRARPELPEAEHAREAVETLVPRIPHDKPQEDLQQELNVTAERVRWIFEELISK